MLAFALPFVALCIAPATAMNYNGENPEPSHSGLLHPI